MTAKTGIYALALGAALAMASGVMASDTAMAQADDAAMQADEAAAQAGETAARGDDMDDMTAREEAGQEQASRQQPVADDQPDKSDLDQSAVRAAPVVPSPRATRTITRAIAMPKILGSYR